MEKVLNFIAEHGLPHLILGVIIINFIGLLKLCKVFAGIKNAGVKKFIYYALDIILSFGAVAVYYKLYNIDFANFILYSVEQLSLTTTIYAIYENFHLRDGWKAILNWVGSWFKKNPEHEITKFAKKLGFDKAITVIVEEKAQEKNKEEAKNNN